MYLFCGRGSAYDGRRTEVVCQMQNYQVYEYGFQKTNHPDTLDRGNSLGRGDSAFRACRLSLRELKLRV